MSIVVQDLRKNYGPVQAVDGVSFEIPGPGIIGLIGPNGSGKTTILRMLATYLTPSSGRIVIAGKDLADDPVAVRRFLGYLPEALPGYSDARVEEFLEFRASLKEIPRRSRQAEIDRCLALCQLTAVRRRLVGRLSQGFRRRVGLADALLGNPRIVLLDEPTVGLDPLQVLQTRELLQDLATNATVLVSTHLLAEAQAVCQRVLMLVRGKLAADVPLAELRNATTFEITLRAPAEESRKRLQALAGVQSIRPIAAPEGLTTWQVTAATEDVREQSVRECVARGWGVTELRSLNDDLERHFVRVVLDLEREAA